MSAPANKVDVLARLRRADDFIARINKNDPDRLDDVIPVVAALLDIDLNILVKAAISWGADFERRHTDHEGVTHLTLGPNHFDSKRLLDKIGAAQIALARFGGAK